MTVEANNPHLVCFVATENVPLKSQISEIYNKNKNERSA